MKQSRGLSLLVVCLAVVALLPQMAMANKRIYKAKIKNGAVSGSSLLRQSPFVSGWSFLAYVRGVNGGVRQVWIVDAKDGFQLPVCGFAGAVELDCTHDPETGDLDFETVIPGGALQYTEIGADLINQIEGIPTPWSGRDWLETLEAEEAEVWILYDDDGIPPFDAAIGTYLQIFP